MIALNTTSTSEFATLSSRQPAKISIKPMIVALALSFSSAPLWSQSIQNVPSGAEEKSSSDASSEVLRNGFAQKLTPKPNRTATKKNELYNPIKKPDDNGQVPEIEMFVGESRVFPTPGVARIAVGNGSIMSAAALDDKEVIVFANGVGTSSLFVWNEDGRYQRVKVNIVPGDTSRISREVAAFLSMIPNAKASVVGDKVIVEGDELSDADREKVAELAKRYPQIVNFTSPIGWEQMVMMDVKVVEFPKSELRELGLKWNPTGGAAIGGIWSPIRRGDPDGRQINLSGSQTPPITAQGGTGSVVLPSALTVLSVMNMGLNAQLNMLEQNGTASILAEPQLSTRSGYKASFLAGGEFPYSVASINGVTVVFKPYGIKLDIEPKVGRNGVIRAVIESEVSSIDSSVSSTAGPALLTRKTKTEFNVKAGETIVLSGLLQRSTSTDIDKVPLLGDIPVLGALFRSKRFQNKETELVVFVTPTIVDSHSPGLVDRVQKATERLSENLGKTPYLSNPLQPGSEAAKVNQVVAPSASTLPVDGMTPLGHAVPVSSTQNNQLIPASQNPFQPVAAPVIQTGVSGSSLRVKQDGLVLRAEPNAKSAALLELGLNSLVQLGAAAAQPPGTALWRNVVVGELNGWVQAKYVEPYHLQSQDQVDRKSTVARTDQSGKLLALGVNVKSSANSSDARAYVPAATGQRFRVLLNGLVMRVSPDVNALVVQKLEKNDVVESAAQPLQGTWIEVTNNGKRGWVASQWLKPVAL